MEVKDVFKKVHSIEIKARRLSNHIFSGEYHSSFKGSGMTFTEVRHYQYGDDVRAIDWNKTAHFNEPYVKIFEEERELTVLLMVDVSRSMFFGTRQQTKRETITEICATLAFSARQNNDKVGLLMFSQEVERYIPPKKGKFHILRIIQALITFEPKSTTTDIGIAYQFIGKILKRNAIIFTLSDFNSEPYDKALRMIARKHDVTGIRIYDEKEQSIPNVGICYMRDIETGEICAINTASKTVRNEYRKFYEKLTRSFMENFQRAGAKTLNIRADEDYIKQLVAYFKKYAV